jgi:bifunctional non-homologous end joining protein LigD
MAPGTSTSSGADDLTLDVDGHAIAVSHPARVYWPAARGRPAITKGDYLAYLMRFAKLMLPHLADRPLTLWRWPEGLAGRRVMMKHWEIRLPPFAQTVDVYSESKGRPDQYLLCNNRATLVWLAQMGTLELHAWHSRTRPAADAKGAGTDFGASLSALRDSVLERPDYLLFDIDPFLYTGRERRPKQPESSPAGFERSRDVALWLHELLETMSLDSFVKTSGKTGLHVAVPIRRVLRYDAVREIARVVAEHVARAHRDQVTVDWSIERRTGKVFIDYNMNVRGKSITVPYSPRGLDGAPVSVPLTWTSLVRFDASDAHIAALMSRRTLPRDPWSTLLTRKQDLAARLQSGIT